MFETWSCAFCHIFILTVNVLALLVLAEDKSLTLSIGTFNLWNVMFGWKTRIQHVGKMIQEHDLDIVVLQEVRLNKCEDEKTPQHCPSQLDQLQRFLREYRWVLARPAGAVSKVKSSIDGDWHLEGLGVITRREILSSEVFNLRQTSFQDRNKRIAFHVRLKLGYEQSDVADVIVVHFSYDPEQQCDNAEDIRRFIKDRGLTRAIIIGDFNVYGVMSPAVGQFVGSSADGQSCPGIVQSDQQTLGNFQDVWDASDKSHKQGLTFSNMPTPGPQSRPDRILVSKDGVEVQGVGLAGNGSDYWDLYGQTAIYQRAWAVLKSGYSSLLNVRGYNCLHDCGPHGSCRCGVCIKGGNANNCHLPNCSECSGASFLIFVILFVMISVTFLVLFLSVVRILVITARFNQSDIMDLLGYRCCLFNRQLYQFKILPRKFRIQFLWMLQVFNSLPPSLAAFMGLLLLCVTSGVMYVVFLDSFQVVMSILPEEKFPSDHQMVFVRLKFS